MRIIIILLILISTLINLYAQTPKPNEKQEKYKEQMALIENGKKAPNFEYINIDGDTISQESMKGEIIVIDLWATWCKPCVAELPAFEKLKKQYVDQDVHFVNISLDRDFNTWKDYVEKNQLNEIQLYTGGIFNPPAYYYALDYMTISLKESDEKPIAPSVPRYVIIDKDLTILNNNAPKPSSDEFVKILDGYLK